MVKTRTKPKIRWTRASAIKTESPEPEAETETTDLALTPTAKDIPHLAALRKSLKRKGDFQLTTREQEWRQAITSVWTAPPVPTDDADVKSILKHRLWLCRELNDVFNVLTQTPIDCMTALVICAEFILRGKDKTLELIEHESYAQFGSHPKIKRVRHKHIFVQPQVWAYLREELGIISPFYATIQVTDRADFDILDPADYSSKPSRIIIEESFSNTLQDALIRYKAAQSILEARVSSHISIENLLSLLGDLNKFNHIGRRTALLILSGILIQGYESCAEMIRLGVAVDCSDGQPFRSIEPTPGAAEAALLASLRFLTAEQRFELRALSSSFRDAVRSQHLEERALQEVLDFTNGVPLPRFCDELSTWHAYHMAVRKYAQQSLSSLDLTLPSAYQSWKMRVNYLLSGTNYALTLDAAATTENDASQVVWKESPPNTEANAVVVHNEVLMSLAVPQLEAAEVGAKIIRSLLLDVDWHHVIVSPKPPQTPHRILQWANGLTPGEGLPDRQAAAHTVSADQNTSTTIIECMQTFMTVARQLKINPKFYDRCVIFSVNDSVYRLKVQS